MHFSLRKFRNYSNFQMPNLHGSTSTKSYRFSAYFCIKSFQRNVAALLYDNWLVQNGIRLADVKMPSAFLVSRHRPSVSTSPFPSRNEKCLAVGNAMAKSLSSSRIVIK